MTTTVHRVWRVAAARAVQGLGWAGVAGIGLALVGVAWTAVSWREHRTQSFDVSASVSAPQITPVGPTDPALLPAPPIPLPSRADVPLLLTQLQRAAIGQGLGWPAADYKVSPATDTAPAMLEVRCTLKGPYPKLRGMVTQALSTVPGLAIRDLSMSRPTSEAVDVEVKLVMVVFLQDEATTSDAASSKKAVP